MSNEIAKKEGFQLPSAESMLDMKELMAEEMDGLTFSFDSIKIPSGGGISFEVPSDDPESPDSEKSIDGVIVFHHAVNGYWDKKFDGENESPKCASTDGHTGIEFETGEVKNCKECPLNKFGSAEDGKGKACKNMRRIYILREGDMFPLLLVLPPTSIRNFSDYIAKRIVSKGLRSYGVVTRVTLKKAKSNAGITYSQALFTNVQKLSQDEMAFMKSYAEDIKEKAMDVSVEEEVAEQRNPSDYQPVDELEDDNIPF